MEKYSSGEGVVIHDLLAGNIAAQDSDSFVIG
jgi:hypothetical protein